jgi:acetolactate synthase-1/2/3 large subunit
MNPTPSRIAGHAIVEQLLAFGVDRVFGVPGESYLDVLDGLYEHRDQIEMIIARQEGGAAIMAAVYGRLTGRPGICLVTRGPGATNASIGVHVASQDATPLVLMIGQVPRRAEGRRAFQEIDYHAMFGTLAKQVIEVNLASRAPEQIARALTVAMAGEPGPVVVVLPEDVLLEETSSPIMPALPRPDPQPAAHEMTRATDLLRASSSPLIIAGSIQWDAETAELLAQFAEKSGIPVVTAARRQDVIDNDSPAYVGSLGLGTTAGLEHAVSDADTVLLLATRPDGLTLADTTLALAPGRERRLVHVYPDADIVGQLYPADVSIVSSPKAFLRALPGEIHPTAVRRAWMGRLQAAYGRNLRAAAADEPAASYMRIFNQHFNGATLTTVGAGNYTSWPQRHHRNSVFPSQIGSQSGAMGVSIPAAAATGLALPGRDVVAFAGDGCFLMNGQELSTINRYGLDVLVIIINNSTYGTIREHQESRYPGRTMGTDLVNPDFIVLAESFGAKAVRVASPSEFDAALATLKSTKGLRLIEIDLTSDDVLSCSEQR